jgi:hypothetical protein
MMPNIMHVRYTKYVKLCIGSLKMAMKPKKTKAPAKKMRGGGMVQKIQPMRKGGKVGKCAVRNA